MEVKRTLTFNGIHGVISQNVELQGYILGPRETNLLYFSVLLSPYMHM
jgi:hypothetical protein